MNTCIYIAPVKQKSSEALNKSLEDCWRHRPMPSSDTLNDRQWLRQIPEFNRSVTAHSAV